MKNTYLFVAPHQDDELLSMGVLAYKYNKDMESECHVLLCTDGSKTRVSHILNNRKRCLWHKGKHCYELNPQKMTEARDKEFIESCEKLGFATDKIHIPDKRAIDGKLTHEIAGEMIESVIKDIKKDAKITIITVFPFEAGKQHADHTTVGEAAKKLYASRKIDSVIFCREPYCLNKKKDENKILKPTKEERKVLRKAIYSYCRWNPKQGRYAVGFHSVKKELIQFYILSKNYIITNL